MEIATTSPCSPQVMPISAETLRRYRRISIQPSYHPYIIRPDFVSQLTLFGCHFALFRVVWRFFLALRFPKKAGGPRKVENTRKNNYFAGLNCVTPFNWVPYFPTYSPGTGEIWYILRSPEGIFGILFFTSRLISPGK